MDASTTTPAFPNPLTGERIRRLTPARLARALAALTVFLAIAAVLGLAVGSSGVRLDTSTNVLSARAPRVVLAAIVGGALATAGVVFQALLRNPLADPFILGVSGGAAAGAVGAIVFGAVAAAAVPVAAFAGALGATALVYALARARAGLESERLILTGVVVNAFLSALILLLNHLAPPGRRLQILQWMTGSLREVGSAELSVVAALTVAGLTAFIATGRDLDLLATGEDAAAHLGVNVRRARVLLFFAASLVTGAAVSVSGLIGFVGLIVPHALRFALGPDHRLLVPAAFLGGGTFLVLADAAARSIAAPEELPVGVISALCGGPFFVALLLSRRGRDP